MDHPVSFDMTRTDRQPSCLPNESQWVIVIGFLPRHQLRCRNGASFATNGADLAAMNYALTHIQRSIHQVLLATTHLLRLMTDRLPGLLDGHARRVSISLPRIFPPKHGWVGG